MDSEVPPSPTSPMEALLERLGRHHNWVGPLVGRTCSRVTVDMYRPPLVLWFLFDGPAARVEINVPFRVSVGPAVWSLDPTAELGALAPVLTLIERKVTEAIAADDGSLHLEFGDDATLDVNQAAGDTEPWWLGIDDETSDPMHESG